MSKVTMQDIADALHTSRITVWKAFNNREGVSQQLKEQILQTAQEMGYNMKTDVEPVLSSEKFRNVALVVSRPETSVFWMNIVHQIARELSVHHINLIYVYLPTSFSPGYTLPRSLSDGTICGCIVMNVYDPIFTEMLNNLDIPKVFLDIVNSFPTETLNGDLVLLEGRETFSTMFKEFLAKGFTRFGFIGNVDYARTNCLRYKGFLDGLRSAQLECPPEWQLLSFEKSTDYNEEVQLFLRQLDSFPEVFFCVNDHVSYVAGNCLQDMGFNNKDILLAGHDGSAEHSSHSFLASTVLIDTALLGSRLASLLLFRMAHPGSSREVVYVYSDIIHPFICPPRQD